MKSPTSHLRTLAVALGATVLLELLLLRTGTRTLIHIPGLGRFDVQIGVLGAVGRFAYYAAAVLLVAAFVYLSYYFWIGSTAYNRVIPATIWLFLITAALARSGVVEVTTVSWVAMLVLVSATVATWRGLASLPISLFAGASVLGSWAVLGQGSGGGLSPTSVDFLVLGSEGLLVLAGLSSPLLLKSRPSRVSTIAGLAALVIVALGFSVGGSTLSILTLWNLGIPGWLPPFAFGMALGGVVTTVWSSLATRVVENAVGLLMILAGGVGVISTYQTGLGLAGILLLGVAAEVSHESEDPASPRTAVDALEPSATQLAIPIGVR